VWGPKVVGLEANIRWGVGGPKTHVGFEERNSSGISESGARKMSEQGCEGSQSDGQGARPSYRST